MMELNELARKNDALDGLIKGKVLDGMFAELKSKANDPNASAAIQHKIKRALAIVSIAKQRAKDGHVPKNKAFGPTTDIPAIKTSWADR